MTDYQCQYASTAFCRSFTTPPLDFVDVSEAELLAKIEAVESYCNTVYETGDKVACSLLVLAKLVQNPTIAKKYCTLNAETIGKYSYRLGSISGKSPFEIAKSWEQLGYEILRSKSFTHNDKLKIYLVND